MLYAFKTPELTGAVCRIDYAPIVYIYLRDCRYLIIGENTVLVEIKIVGNESSEKPVGEIVLVYPDTACGRL